MIIDVDIAARTAVVHDPQVLTGFSATSTTTEDTVVADAMGTAGEAAGDGHVWVDAGWIRAQVCDGAAPGWGAQFDAMVAYASGKGWSNDAGTHIKAHIESEGG